ncbi:MAG: cytochrome c family protein [Paracoccus denitrificans]|uniref:Cytochrome c family protein n=1 Tax=Paracoccus denitrificans TaxID=266 RepID=A0A533IC62_PARDE|nr:MAG: cytochrome c family protein [Paracoccus denitrificans]
MFNTMTITKAASALIGSLLTLLLLFWAGTALFHVGPAEGAHGDEPAVQAYSIPVESTGGGEAEEEVQIDFAALMEAADPAKGEKVFAKCKACHKLDGTDGTGPHLNGVVGRPVASASGFNYDDAMREHAAVAPEWTPDALQEFLADPKGVVPGTKMTFAGLPKPEDRADLVAYLQANP